MNSFRRELGVSLVWISFPECRTNKDGNFDSYTRLSKTEVTEDGSTKSPCSSTIETKNRIEPSLYTTRKVSSAQIYFLCKSFLLTTGLCGAKTFLSSIMRTCPTRPSQREKEGGGKREERGD